MVLFPECDVPRIVGRNQLIVVVGIATAFGISVTINVRVASFSKGRRIRMFASGITIISIADIVLLGPGVASLMVIGPGIFDPPQGLVSGKI